MKSMKDAFLKLTDDVSLNLVDALRLKDNFVQSSNVVQTSKGLIVKIAATHAGIVNRNNMFYMPDKMKAGATSFYSPFQKPVLTNHNEEASPIGRIVAATYVDTSSYIKDKLRGKKIRDMIVTDKLIDSFCDGTMPVGAQIDFVRTYLKDSILDDPDYEGLGFIEITAHITDKDAIEKFLDGRYLTGSVGAGTDRASCSVCKQDWSKDGMCDHRPGKIYDGTKCYMIAGNFEYDEFSMVNKPADRHAKVRELNFGGLRDNVRVEDIEFSGKLYEVRVAFPKEEEVMKLKDNETTTEVVPPVTTEVKTQDKVESLEDFLARVLDASKELSDADDEKLYSLVVDEMKTLGLSDQELADATLSAEKRKALPKTSFGVENRALPLTDKAHLLATKKLLDKYAGKKDEVLAVLDRKAKALDVSLEDTIVQPPADQIGEAEIKRVDDAKKLGPNQFRALVLGLLNYAKDSHADLFKEVARSYGEKALVDEVVSLETTVGTLRSEVKKITDAGATLRTEYEIATKEAEVLQDEVVKTKAALRDSKVKSLTLYKSLKSGTVVESVDTTITDATIDSELETIAKEVDIKKITDKLNDGTSRKPAGSVQNPGGVQDNVVVDAQVVKGKLEKIRARYYELKFQNSILADQYLANEMQVLKAAGLLPKDSE